MKISNCVPSSIFLLSDWLVWAVCLVSVFFFIRFSPPCSAIWEALTELAVPTVFSEYVMCECTWGVHAHACACLWRPEFNMGIFLCLSSVSRQHLTEFSTQGLASQADQQALVVCRHYQRSCLLRPTLSEFYLMDSLLPLPIFDVFSVICTFHNYIVLFLCRVCWSDEPMCFLAFYIVHLSAFTPWYQTDSLPDLCVYSSAVCRLLNWIQWQLYSLLPSSQAAGHSLCLFFVSP